MITAACSRTRVRHPATKGEDVEDPTRGTIPLRRIAALIGLVEEHADAYLSHHGDVWPEVLDALRRANVTNSSIYRHGDLLVSYLEYRGTDYEADMACLAEDPATQRWWEIMMPMQRTLRTTPEDPWWTELEEVFHLE